MLKLLIILTIIVLGTGFGLTWINQKLPQQTLFRAGRTPDPKPNGDYKGSALITGSWKGKTFDASKSAGLNLVDEKGKTVKKYPFKTYVTKSVIDTDRDILKLDYNLPENPFWARMAHDEIVQTDKNKYLGKVYFNLIPSKPFVLGFFNLEK